MALSTCIILEMKLFKRENCHICTPYEGRFSKVVVISEVMGHKITTIIGGNIDIYTIIYVSSCLIMKIK